MSKQDMENAIDRLAALIESGELIAATDPVGFMNVVADKIEALTEKADYAETKLIEADALAFKQVNRADDLQEELDRMKDRVERADEEVTIVENALEDAKSDIDTLQAKVKGLEDELKSWIEIHTDIIKELKEQLRIAEIYRTCERCGGRVRVACERCPGCVRPEELYECPLCPELKGRLVSCMEDIKEAAALILQNDKDEEVLCSDIVRLQKERDTLKADKDWLRGALEEIQRSSELQAGAVWGTEFDTSVIEWYRLLCEDVLKIVNKALQDNPKDKDGE